MERKLVVKTKKFKGETSVVSSRLPNELLRQIDDIAEKTGRTRNEIVQLCLEFAVDNLEIQNDG